MSIGLTKGTKKFIKVISVLLFFVYIAILSYVLFLSPYYGRISTEMHAKSINLEFLKTIKNYIKYRNIVNNTVLINNLVGNVVAFVPMGYFIPIIFSKARGFFRMLLLTAFISLAVEIIQYEFAVGIFDVDDIILNTFGGIIGYIIYKGLRLIIPIKSI